MPKKYKPDDKSRFCDTIIERVSEGVPLAQVCREIGLPLMTWYEWAANSPDLAQRIARAREAGFDIIATETVEIVDTIPERTNTEHGSKVDAGHVAWLKNRAEQRLKLLAKWDPKRYGEKIAIGGADGLPPMQVETLDPTKLSSAALAEILAAKK